GEGGESQTDNEKIVLANRSPGIYYVRVYALAGVAGRPNVAYSLRVGVQERAYLCENDEFEFNETTGTATNLGTRLTSIDPRGEVDESGVVSANSQWLCQRNPNDIDMWRFVVRDNTDRVVGIVRSADSGDAFVEVFADGGDVVPVASTKIDFRGLAKQCIVIPARPGDAERIFYLSVSSVSITTDDERMDYALFVENGDDCGVIPGDDPGQGWPSVAP
ncbi:MAG: hypothetical protein VX589_08135, partial [Myxococcota bacterium]|nr:hypothetical protein [Myxococcota bacterium]